MAHGVVTRALFSRLFLHGRLQRYHTMPFEFFKWSLTAILDLI